MNYDPGLVERVRDLVPRLGGVVVREKMVFGGRSFMLGRLSFLIVWGEGILVKLPPAEYQPALDTPGVTAFAPMGGKAMSTWVLVQAEEVADDPELLEWAQRGIRGVRSAPAPRTGRGRKL